MMLKEQAKASRVRERARMEQQAHDTTSLTSPRIKAANYRPTEVQTHGAKDTASQQDAAPHTAASGAATHVNVPQSLHATRLGIGPGASQAPVRAVPTLAPSRQPDGTKIADPVPTAKPAMRHADVPVALQPRHARWHADLAPDSKEVSCPLCEFCDCWGVHHLRTAFHALYRSRTYQILQPFLDCLSRHRQQLKGAEACASLDVLQEQIRQHLDQLLHSFPAASSTGVEAVKDSKDRTRQARDILVHRARLWHAMRLQSGHACQCRTHAESCRVQAIGFHTPKQSSHELQALRHEEHNSGDKRITAQHQHHIPPIHIAPWTTRSPVCVHVCMCVCV